MPQMDAIPSDKAFHPGGQQPASEIVVTADEVLSASNEDKKIFYEAAAQSMANDLDRDVLVHWVKIPAFKRTSATLAAFLIPAHEDEEAPVTEPQRRW